MPFAVAILQPRTVEFKGAKQGAERATRVGLELERRAAVRARRAGVEKGVNLLLKELTLQAAEELFGLSQGQPEMLDALVGFVEGEEGWPSDATSVTVSS